MGKSASDLVDQAESLLGEALKATVTETRQLVAAEIKRQCVDATDGDKQIVTLLCALGEYELHNRLSVQGISRDFLAGVEFACRLMADPDYEF